MPTIRQSANIKKRVAHGSLAAGFIATAILFKHFAPTQNEMSFVYFIPFLLGGLVMVAVQFATKCQACGGNIAPIIMATGNPITASKKVKYCPYCGISIDTEISSCRGQLSKEP
ncbi:MAG TPA: hypothetical protein PKH78_11775 [Candidatus Obscuribacter sp.]|nr:hypothetical protein [Candidatus Obscuribacter sp.]